MYYSLLSTFWILAAVFTLYVPLTTSQNCWYIINVQTGQYLQSPQMVNQQNVWLSHNRTDSSYWNLVPLQRGNFYIVNRKSDLYLGMPPNEEFAVLRSMGGGRRKSGKAQSATSFQFRLHDRQGEIVSTAGKTSLYAEICGGGVDGKVKATARCGLPQCQWRFEGYTCD